MYVPHYQADAFTTLTMCTTHTYTFTEKSSVLLKMVVDLLQQNNAKRVGC